MSASYEVDMILVQVPKGFAQKFLANPGGLRVWLRDTWGATLTEVPLGVWHTKGVYDENPKEGRPIYHIGTKLEKLAEKTG
jgi:hypothetical protein